MAHFFLQINNIFVRKFNKIDKCFPQVMKFSKCKERNEKLLNFPANCRKPPAVFQRLVKFHKCIMNSFSINKT